jgi:hypothetical protein
MASNRPQRHRSEDHQSAGINCLPGRLVFAACARNISNDRRQRKVENFIARGRCLERLSSNSNFQGSFLVPEPSRLALRDCIGVLLDDNPLGIKAAAARRFAMKMARQLRCSSITHQLRYVPLQSPVRLGPRCRRPILIATKGMFISGTGRWVRLNTIVSSPVRPSRPTHPSSSMHPGKSPRTQDFR